MTPSISNLRTLAIGLAVLLSGGCADPPAPETRAPQRPRPVKSAVVGVAAAAASDAFSATVQSRDAVPIAFRVGGTVLELAVNRGDRVKAGERLGVLDQADLKAQLAQARANQASAVAQRDLARRTLQRTERLYESGAATRSDLENAKGQVSTSEAQLAAAAQSARQSANALSSATLEAPFDGIVEAVHAKPGETVPAGQPVVVVSRGGELEVRIGVPESVVPRLTVGLGAQVTVAAAGGPPLSGRVTEVGFAPERSTYPISVAFDAPNPALRPGMAASVVFDMPTQAAEIAVPAAAVGDDGEGNFAYRLDPSDDGAYTARRIRVVVGPLQGDAFPVTEGLAAGDRVATAGLAYLVDGAAVRLLEAAPQ